MSAEMEFTGERFVPQIHGNIELEHMHRYLVACDLAAGKDVLDIACGEGYGSARLALSARKVYGVDISDEVVVHASANYVADNIRFLVGSCDAIPLPDRSVDLVVSFETIEHHDKHDEMMLEIKRVLRPNGVVIISSPDKQTYSIEPNYRNPYHVKELFAGEFRELLSNHFRNTKHFGQKITYGSAILEQDGSSPQKSYWDENGQIHSNGGSYRPVYLLSIASDSELPVIYSGIYDRPESECGYASYLGAVIVQRDSQIEELHHLVGERDRWLAERDRWLAERDQEIANLNAIVESSKAWQSGLDLQIEELHQFIGERDRKLEETDQLLAERAGEVATLKAIVASAKAWQKRSWAKRAFHRWTEPGCKRKKVNPLKRLERSIRKRRNRLLGSRFKNNGQFIGHFNGKQNDQSEVRETSRLMIPDLREGLFVPIVTEAPTSRPPVKAICFYLPQFHPIPENNEWWGEGFTEWTNVRPAKPQFEGHYQPHVPGELGYYNLLNEGVQQRQVELAKLYGLGGFCFYFYWFHGHRLLEDPILRYLADPSLDLPFCLCWANENWSRRWDGSEQDILIAQDHSPQDDLAFIKYISIYLNDSRYIRVGGKPLVLLYRPSLLPDIAETVSLWRDWCRKNGVGEIYLAYTQSFNKNDPKDFGFDAAVEFPPNNSSPREVRRDGVVFDRDFSGKTYDICSLGEQSSAHPKPDYKFFRSVCPSWDNTARKKSRGTIFCNSSPSVYGRWLKNAVRETIATFPEPDERLVFINAWNEWAEGAHLEPDQKYGYAWLDATRKALFANNIKSSRGNNGPLRVLVVGHDACRAGAQIVLLQMLNEWAKQSEVSFKLILIEDGDLRHVFEQICETMVLSQGHDTEKRTELLEAFVDFHPEVILSNTVVNGPHLRALKYLDIPVVSYVHELQKSIARWAPGAIMDSTLFHSNHFIAVSQPVLENLVKNHEVQPDRISIINPYIKTQFSTSAETVAGIRHELRIKKEELIVIGCGTADWRKGPDLFVQTAIQVCREISAARFIWIGSGDEHQLNQLRLTINLAGLPERIWFIGEKINPRDYLACGNVFFLSSREDPYPLVALEAADASLPVVCFADAGGMPNFVTDECGQTVSFEDTYAAADAIMRLLSDEGTRRSLGEAAQSKVRIMHDSREGSLNVLDCLRRIAYFENQPTSSRPGMWLEGSPLVSVIVPNYNHEKYLPERLASIANQTFSDFEIILLDDASTDKSVSVLQDFAAREPRARLILNNYNSGSTFKQWRKGFMESKGKYIWIAESDDSAHPDLLQTLVGKLEVSKNAIIATCRPNMVDLEGKDLGFPKDWFLDIGGSQWEADFSIGGLTLLGKVMCKKNAILNASGVVFRNSPENANLVDDSMRLCADWLFWVRLLAKGDFEYISKPLNFWRQKSSNARTKPAGELEWSEGFNIIKELADIIMLDQSETKLVIDDFRDKCNSWKNY